jgi:hypothetical protein
MVSEYGYLRVVNIGTHALGMRWMFYVCASRAFVFENIWIMYRVPVRQFQFISGVILNPLESVRILATIMCPVDVSYTLYVVVCLHCSINSVKAPLQ